MGPNLFTNRGADATLNVKAARTQVYSLTCYNGNAAARYIQLHNTATTPGASDVPTLSFLVPAGAMIVVGNDFLSKFGLTFSAGLAFAFSTTQNTYTAGTAADQSTQIVYT